jgi:hypothetical protein
MTAAEAAQKWPGRAGGQGCRATVSAERASVSGRVYDPLLTIAAPRRFNRLRAVRLRLSPVWGKRKGEKTPYPAPVERKVNPRRHLKAIDIFSTRPRPLERTEGQGGQRG